MSQTYDDLLRRFDPCCHPCGYSMIVIRALFRVLGNFGSYGYLFFVLCVFVRLWGITKKMVPVKSFPQPETRTIANSGLSQSSIRVFHREPYSVKSGNFVLIRVIKL